MKRILTLVLALWTTAATLMAIPADPRPRTFTQADGTTITLRLRGDECFHFMSTLDGMPVVKNQKGFYCYAEVLNNTLVPTAMIAHDVEKRSADEQSFVNNQKTAVLASLTQIHNEAKATLNAQRAKQMAQQPAPNKAKFEGTKRGLVILVQFKNRAMSAAGTQAEFNDMMNKPGYDHHGHIGSVNDYFKDQSYGKFDLQFDVAGPVQLKYDYSYYGQDNSDSDIDIHVGSLVKEAILGVDAEIDFSQYDWNNDGEVDQVYVIYAGPGQHTGAESSTIWPHQFYLQYSDVRQKVKLDGVYVNTYAIGSELQSPYSSDLTGIGTMIHEYTHCLGIPDFYDVQYGGGWGLNVWSVMDAGSYNNDSRCPVPYTAHERILAGWLEPVELNAATVVSEMKPITEAPEAYIIYNDGYRNEYYLLENRQQRSWDKYSKGHGMLITHVDYRAKDWADNTVNIDPNHQRMTIIPADNSYGAGSGYTSDYELSGDPFPGVSGNTQLTDQSKPAAKLFNSNIDGSKLMHKPIENIKESKDGLITFSFMGGERPEAPAILAETNVSENAFTINWEAVEKASSYTVELRELADVLPEENTLITESFELCMGTQDGGDGAMDISSMIDDYTLQSGWSGSRLYDSPSRLKLGSQRFNGVLTTPLLKVPGAGVATVKFTHSNYGTLTSIGATVEVVDASGAVLAQQSVNLEGKSYVLHFEGITSDFKVSLKPSARAYIEDMTVYNGKFTTADFEEGGNDSKTQTFEGITETSYTFTGLTANRYEYRVKAVNKEGESEWSESKKINLKSVVEGITAAPIVGGWAEVFTMDGRRVGSFKSNSALQQLPAGIYVVRQAGMTRKYLVK